MTYVSILFLSESEEPQAVIIEQVPEDKIGELGQAFEVSVVGQEVHAWLTQEVKKMCNFKQLML